MGISAGLFAVAALGAVSANETRKASDISRRGAREASQVQNKRATLRNQRQKQRLLADARLRRADIEAAGVSRGAGGSSAVAGATASTGAQAASTLSFSNIDTGLGIAAADIQNRAASKASKNLKRASLFSTAASAATPFVGGGKGAIQNRAAFSDLFQ